MSSNSDSGTDTKGTDHKGVHFTDLLKAGQEAASDVKHKLFDAKDVTVDKATSIYAAVTSAIKARPLLSVGIAFGVGYFAMRMFRPRHRNPVSAAH